MFEKLMQLLARMLPFAATAQTNGVTKTLPPFDPNAAWSEIIRVNGANDSSHSLLVSINAVLVSSAINSFPKAGRNRVLIELAFGNDKANLVRHLFTVVGTAQIVVPGSYVSVKAMNLAALDTQVGVSVAPGGGKSSPLRDEIEPNNLPFAAASTHTVGMRGPSFQSVQVVRTPATADFTLNFTNLNSDKLGSVQYAANEQPGPVTIPARCTHVQIVNGATQIDGCVVYFFADI